MKLAWAALVALAACKKEESPTAPPPPPLRVLGCADAPEPYDPFEGIGTIGTGRYGVIGHGAGTGYGYPMAHEPASIVTDGELAVQGSLDKNVVRRYLRRHRLHMSYCYEKALLDKPDLRGKLETKFAITPGGNVVTATASFSEPSVGTCVADVIKEIEFPKQEAGSTVMVEAAFTFAPNPKAPKGGAIASLVGTESGSPTSIEQWTPVASGPLFPSDHDTATAGAAKIALDLAHADLERCFAGSSATGSLRTMISVPAQGDATIRSGGFGDAVIEACVTTTLRRIHFALSGQPREIACELARGEPALLRVVPDRYTVVGASKSGVTPADASIAKDKVALVRIENDASPATISDALTLAAQAPATLVAVHDELVGIAPTPPASTRFVVELRVNGGVVTACRLGAQLEHPVQISDPKALREALGTWRHACGPIDCHLRVAGDSASAPELAMLAEAARYGTATILAIAPDHGCGS